MNINSVNKHSTAEYGVKIELCCARHKNRNYEILRSEKYINKELVLQLAFGHQVALNKLHFPTR